MSVGGTRAAEGKGGGEPSQVEAATLVGTLPYRGQNVELWDIFSLACDDAISEA